jgi:hypothetical protein
MNYQAGGKIDVETILPLGLIRTHTRTDDVMRVSDMQLEMYRDAAFEMAEQYSGLTLRGTREIVEPISVERQSMIARGIGKISLLYVPVDGVVNLIGDAINEVLLLQDGSRVVDFRSIIIGGSCRASACSAVCDGMSFQYRTGMKCAKDVPSSIKIGCLQYIAWAIENPGDMTDAWSVTASGAIAQWSQHRSMVF